MYAELLTQSMNISEILFNFLLFIKITHTIMLLRKTNSTIFYRLYLFISIFSSVSFIFGAITMTAGIIGVPLGAYLSTNLSKKYPRSDPVICAMGLLLSAPLISAAMIMVTQNAPLAYVLVFLGEVALNLNWAIVADMLLVRFHSQLSTTLPSPTL